MARQTFPGITSEAYISDADKAAMDALKKVPLLPKIIQKFHEIGADRWMYCWNISMCVRCGPKQYPTLDKILRESCTILDMPEPELYVSSSPFPNAFAGGVERPYIIVRNSIIDTLSDEELYHLIGHELGHIKAGHLLYSTVARLLAPLLDMIGRRTLGLGDVATIGLTLAMAEWWRQAEISCDRAGLLVSQNLETSLRANLALTAGPNRLSDEANLEAFMEQARAYQDMGPLDSIGKAIWFMIYGATATHPMPVHRTKLLERWHNSGSYEMIMEGHYPRTSADEAKS